LNPVCDSSPPGKPRYDISSNIASYFRGGSAVCACIAARGEDGTLKGAAAQIVGCHRCKRQSRDGCSNTQLP
jgi:hypothetical protein